MDGWMDGRTDGWMGRSSDRLMGGWIDGWMDGFCYFHEEYYLAQVVVSYSRSGKVVVARTKHYLAVINVLGVNSLLYTFT